MSPARTIAPAAGGGVALGHQPWWHTRGHLSDYAACRPRTEHTAGGLDVGALAADGQQDAAAAARPAQAGHFRDEFLNMAAEVPELTAMFVPDAQPEGVAAAWPHNLPLSLDPTSLHSHLSNVYRQRAPARRTTGGPCADVARHGPAHATSVGYQMQPTSVGYQMQRVWLDAALSHLGGACGRIPVQLPVQRALRNVKQHACVPEGPEALKGDGAGDEASRFYLPDSLCLELEVDASLNAGHARGETATGVRQVRQVNTARGREAAGDSGPGEAGLSGDSGGVPAKLKPKGKAAKSRRGRPRPPPGS